MLLGIIMKIRLFSDLHLEFKPKGYSIEKDIPIMDDDADTVLVLAGDICVGCPPPTLFDTLSDRFKHVVYVTGNHEYYNHDIYQLDTVIISLVSEYDNVHFLTCDEVVIDDVVFYGGTAWTHVPALKQQAVRHSMNDFRAIKALDFETGHIESFTPADANVLNEEFIDGLDRAVKYYSDKDIVVVSHHTPSEQSAAPEFDGNRLNCAYHNSLEKFYEYATNVKLHLHGHVHSANDYMLTETRVVSNPYGYFEYDVNAEYNPKLILEI